ncbi:MAG: hypothetical protein NC187_07650 [Candidatus Amulumruptor caecigallinarius]|nr:hypothetical protein [Candidatus Amulumruptor caecigallinarius]MCM1397343.1 hypothetical protein [Candidatus Amulumruptor caecigallinarius]MCM1453594.1 hypothetical protein [bacterium]
MFSTFLTFIIIGYVLYYAYLIVNDLYLKKEPTVATRAEEEDVDISQEVSQFESEHITRDKTPSHDTSTADNPAVVCNTAGLEISDLMKHIDAFAEGEDYDELHAMMEDWDCAPAA